MTSDTKKKCWNRDFIEAHSFYYLISKTKLFKVFSLLFEKKGFGIVKITGFSRIPAWGIIGKLESQQTQGRGIVNGNIDSLRLQL